MNAYELSEKKNKILRQVQYLRGETGSDTGTVLLTDDEVINIVEALEESVGFMNERLKTAQIV